MKKGVVISLIIFIHGAICSTLRWYRDELCYDVDTLSDHCLPLSIGSTCLGGFPRNTLIGDEFSQNATLIINYENVRLLPQCWQAFREAMCQVAFAPCYGQKRRSASTSKCTYAAKKCIFLRESNYWPDALRQCAGLDGSSLFDDSDLCDKRYDRFIWDWSGRQPSECVSPLVRTRFSSESVFGITGCALNCSFSLYGAESLTLLRNMQKFGSIAAIALCFTPLLIVALQHCYSLCRPTTNVTHLRRVSSIFKHIYRHGRCKPVGNDVTINTASLLDHNETLRDELCTRSPEHNLVCHVTPFLWQCQFYAFCIALLLLLPTLSKSFVNQLICRSDGSLRRGVLRRLARGTLDEPGWLCLTQFVVLFHCVFSFCAYFLLHTVCVFTLRCSYEFFCCQKWCQHFLRSQPVIWYAHLLVWSVSVLFASICVTAGQIDANPDFQLCFVGIGRPLFLHFLVHLPLALMFSFGFILVLVANVKQPKRATKRNIGVTTTRYVMLRLGLFNGLAVLGIISSVLLIHYHQQSVNYTKQALRNLILCNLFPGGAECGEKDDAQLLVLRDPFHLVLMLLPCLVSTLHILIDMLFHTADQGGCFGRHRLKSAKSGSMELGSKIPDERHFADCDNYWVDTALLPTVLNSDLVVDRYRFDSNGIPQIVFSNEEAVVLNELRKHFSTTLADGFPQSDLTDSCFLGSTDCTKMTPFSSLEKQYLSSVFKSVSDSDDSVGRSIEFSGNLKSKITSHVNIGFPNVDNYPIYTPEVYEKMRANWQAFCQNYHQFCLTFTALNSTSGDCSSSKPTDSGFKDSLNVSPRSQFSRDTKSGGISRPFSSNPTNSSSSGNGSAADDFRLGSRDKNAIKASRTFPALSGTQGVDNGRVEFIMHKGSQESLLLTVASTAVSGGGEDLNSSVYSDSNDTEGSSCNTSECEEDELCFAERERYPVF